MGKQHPRFTQLKTVRYGVNAPRNTQTTGFGLKVFNGGVKLCANPKQAAFAHAFGVVAQRAARIAIAGVVKCLRHVFLNVLARYNVVAAHKPGNIHPSPPTGLLKARAATGANGKFDWQAVASNTNAAAHKVQTAHLPVAATAFCFTSHNCLQ
jgi:hypothetical protein